jgi:hypothetical protein
MALRRLAILVAVCLGIWATQARAALVVPANATETPVPPASDTTGPGMVLSARALGPGQQGDALCADRALCQGWNDPFGEVRSSPQSGLLGRTTLLANTALVGIGLLWIVVTRRSLRVAQVKTRRG